MTVVQDDLVRTVPAAGPLPELTLPPLSDTRLDGGLRVVAVRRAGVPLVELRLRVPFAGHGAAHLARATLLADALFSGTADHDNVALAATVQRMGGSMSARADADRLAVGGSVLAAELPGFLDVLGEVLTGAAYPGDQVDGERDRLVQRLAVARSQPGVRAAEALSRRLYGDHPYGRELPEVDDVAAVAAADLRALHAERVAPEGAVLVLVGDLDPDEVLGGVASALGAWRGAAAGAALDPPPVPQPGPVLVVDRPGSVQTTIRMGGPAPRRHDPDHAALKLGNLVFGGYFSSRLVANIRERRGYTYSPTAASTTPPRRRPSPSPPTSRPRSPPPRCWRPPTSWAASRPCPWSPRSWRPPGATRSGRSRCRPRPRPGWHPRSPPWSPTGWTPPTSSTTPAPSRP